MEKEELKNNKTREGASPQEMKKTLECELDFRYGAIAVKTKKEINPFKRVYKFFLDQLP